jgi:hypothetical protein
VAAARKSAVTTLVDAARKQRIPKSFARELPQLQLGMAKEWTNPPNQLARALMVIAAKTPNQV